MSDLAPPTGTAADVELSAVMVEYWTNFAAYGNPNMPAGFSARTTRSGTPPLPLWPAFEATGVRGDVAMQFDIEGGMVPVLGLHRAQCEWWGANDPCYLVHGRDGANATAHATAVGCGNS
jgi:hypothetical protein